MSGIPVLPRIYPGYPAIDTNGNVTPEFTRIWNQFANGLGNSVASLQSQIAQIQATQAQSQAATVQANTALTVADGGGSPGGQSGSQTASNVVVAQTWIDGPVVALTGVSSGNLTFTLNLAGYQSVSNPVTDTGSYRIQQIISGVETTVFTGVITIQSVSVPTYIGGNQLVYRYYAVPVDSSVSGWSGVNFPETSTGAVSYRLDTILNTLLYTFTSLYLYVRRA